MTEGSIDLFTRGQGENPWDDSLLIEQYDKCMSQLKTKVSKLVNEGKEPGDSEKKPNTRRNTCNVEFWNVGMFCRAKYTEDNRYYEASILGIDPDKDTCSVKYIGYENEEEVPIDCLLESKGDNARKVQERVAAERTPKMDDGFQCEGPDILSQNEEKRSRRRIQSPKHFEKKMRRLNDCRRINQPAPDPHVREENVCNAFGPIPSFFPPPHTAHTLDDKEALSAMLMSWYMNGYHTGYYEALQHVRNQSDRNHDFHHHHPRGRQH